jgi:hypothetical protein
VASLTSLSIRSTYHFNFKVQTPKSGERAIAFGRLAEEKRLQEAEADSDPTRAGFPGETTLFDDEPAGGTLIFPNKEMKLTI